MTDTIIRDDIRDCCNDDHFFVFEEMLERIMMAFLRDPWVAKNLKAISALPMVCKSGSGNSVGYFPPAGVVPFKHFCL
jgi:hypothetical protein